MAHAWEKSYPEGFKWDVELPARPIPEFLDEAAESHPERYCCDFLDRRFTFREIRDLADRAAVGFRALGVEKGVQVGLFLPNTPHYLIAFFGILKAGGTVVNFSPLHPERELAYQVEDSETDIMVTLDVAALYPKVEALLESTRLKKVVVGSIPEVLGFPKRLLYRVAKRKDICRVPKDERHVRFADLIAERGVVPAPSYGDLHDEVALLQYTGGTTGMPKGAMLTHGGISSAMGMFKAWARQADHLRRDDDKILLVLPLFHVFGLSCITLVAMSEGSEIILHPRPDIDMMLRDIQKKRPRLLPGVPTLFTAIANHPKAREVDFSSLLYCASGGAPLPAEVQSQFEGLAGVKLLEGYGLTETSPAATAHKMFGDYVKGSCGLPLPGTIVEIRDVDDDSKLMGPNEVGEVCIIGPQLMKGYWNKPEETAKTLRVGDDGSVRLHTGDTGYLDENGYLFLVDRTKDLIISSGYNVYPRVIEEAIYEHPSVAEVTVIGVPDEYRGEVPKAFVSLKNGGGLTFDELTDFLRPRIGKHELPVELEVRDELPKTAVGKLSKKELKEEERRKRQDSANAAPARAQSG